MKIIFKLLSVSSLLFFLASCSENESKVAHKLDPIEVTIDSVNLGSSQHFITASGKIEAENTANISTRLMGYITDVHVKTGQDVVKGQLLVSINNSDLEAKKAQVEANILQANAVYINAKKDYDRFKTLFDQESATRKELDDVTTHYEMTKAGLEAAQQMKNEVLAQYAYANIRAPFSGTITGTFAKEGDLANPGMPIMSMEGNSQFQAKVMVSESDISQIENGLEADVLLKSLNKNVKGEVVEVSSSALNTGGQYIVKLDLENVDDFALSGMFVNAVFPVERTGNQDKVFLPMEALVEYGQLEGVYVVTEDNTAILRWLRLGNTMGNQIEVLAGLSVGEKYILSSSSKLFNGASVEF